MDDLLAQVRAVLATTPGRWSALTAQIPDDLLLREAAPGEWSAVDCLRHLRDGERDVFQVRLRAFQAGQDLVPYDPERDGSRVSGETAADLAADFARLRAESLSLLEGLSPADLEISVTHGEYGPVRLSEMVAYWAAHDLMHTVQAEQALIQPFAADCGPWRVMLADHDLARRD
jgi:hypothetical protein